MVEFARTLRHAGVPASPQRVHSMIEALGTLDVTQATDAYWAGRLTLCADHADLDRYDAAFASYFGGQTVPERTRTKPRTIVRAMPFELDEGSDQHGEDGVESHSVQASRHELLRRRDLATLTPAERAQLQKLFALIRPKVAGRRTRRYRPDRRGGVDADATVRAMLRQGGEPSRLARQRRRTRPRRLVLLIDVSGSMTPYADALLRFAHAATRANPSRTEVFTLGTRLTRVTRELRQRDPDQALKAAGLAIADWSGGTRLGDTLKAFLDRWGQRGVARAAVAVVCSDGWERGDTTVLAEQMVRLGRLAHRVVWVNPHKGKDGFAPVTAGMMAALPSVDELVAGHSLDALEQLAEVIGRA
jgi:uncharacterized protein with von Willebrand factor type A (vWA) domain